VSQLYFYANNNLQVKPQAARIARKKMAATPNLYQNIKTKCHKIYFN